MSEKINLLDTQAETLEILKKEHPSGRELFAVGMSLVVLAFAKDGVTIQDSIDKLRFYLFDGRAKKECEDQLRGNWDHLRNEEWQNVTKNEMRKQ